MKQADVKLGSVYAMKVSGKLAPVMVDVRHVRPAGRIYKREQVTFRGTNLRSGREIVIRSAAKLRYELIANPDTASPIKWLIKKEAKL